MINTGRSSPRARPTSGFANWVHETKAGDFAQFIDAICAAPLTFRGLSVDYTSPSQGRIEFGWRGPFRQNGHELALRDFPRYENTYTKTAFPAERVEIQQGEHWLALDWQKGTRDASQFADIGIAQIK